MTLATHALSVTRGRAHVLRNVTATIEAGRVTAIIGPNGAGKSTLLAALAGTLKPTIGKVTLDDLPMQSIGVRRLARRRGVLAQDFQVAFPFTVAEVVAMGRSPHEAPADPQIVAEAMEAVDIAYLEGRNVMTLSGGERQRVGLAKTLAQVWEPAPPTGANWLLLDEPLAALDPVHQQSVLRTARGFASRGGGVVIVLHDLELAASATDSVLVLKDGVLIEQVAADRLSGDLINTVFTVETDWKQRFRSAP
jgi:iron complex transport system ATP-binding protein